MRGHCDNASASPGGSPTFSTRRDSRRRPLIRNAGRDPLVPISVGAIPTLIIADASGEWVSGACGSSPSRYRSASGVPAASVHARSSRGPGSHCGGTVLTAPRVHSRGDPRPAGRPPRCGPAACSRRCGAISGCRPASMIISASASARHSRSTTTDSRRPGLAPPTSTDLAGRGQDPGQVGDRRRHRLCREERQLAHTMTVGQPDRTSCRRAGNGCTNGNTPARP